MATKKRPSLAALTDPNATDEQFIAAGDQLGPNALGAGQWQQHTAAQRDKQVTDAINDPSRFAPGTPSNINFLQDPVGDAMRQSAQGNAIDPTGAMGFFTSHSQGAFPDETVNRKKKAASLAALSQVMQ